MMSRSFLSASALLVLAAASGVASLSVDPKTGYVRTPAGLFPAECVHHVPHNSVVSVKDTHTEVSTLDGEIIKLLPLCTSRTTDSPPVGPYRSAGLPPDYDGWLEYTQAGPYHGTGLNTFNGSFSVPDQPSSYPDMLYLFTGLQSVPWIPKVDPEPTNGDFDIIQPVLQYPADTGFGWSIKSWYVTLLAGALYSDEIVVESGDVIFGVMERTGPTQYTVSSVSTKQNLATTINPNNKRLTNQPWAYNTLECYGCNGCSTYPTKPCKFTGLVLTDENEKPVSAQWVANPTPAKDRKCHEAVSIIDPATVTVFFDKQA